jgi:hypothetical protein
MLTNGHEADIQGKLAELKQTAFFSQLLGLAEASPLAVRLEAEASHLELAGTSPVSGRPNRGLVKVFPIGPGRFAAFFYKRSQVPFSRDRFAYGAVIAEEKRFRAEDAEPWFKWLDSGFHPERVPPNLKRAFTFTVPD